MSVDSPQLSGNSPKVIMNCVCIEAPRVAKSSRYGPNLHVAIAARDTSVQTTLTCMFQGG